MVRHCFKKMQYSTITMKAQYDALTKLAHDMQMKYEDSPIDEIASADRQVSNEKITMVLSSGSFYSVGLFDGLDHSEQERVVTGLAAAISGFVENVKKIRIEVGNESIEHCPDTPIQVMECADTTFRDLIQRHETQLTEQYGSHVMNDIWKERASLTARYQHDTVFKRRVDAATMLPFGEMWNMIDSERQLKHLTSFLAGIASIAPGTHTVEGEFNILKQIKSAQRASLSNYAIEGQLQAKQYFDLIALADEIAATQTT